MKEISTERRSELEKKRVEKKLFQASGTFAGVIGEDDDILDEVMIRSAMGKVHDSDKGKAVVFFPEEGKYQVESTAQRDERLQGVGIKSVLDNEPVIPAQTPLTSMAV